MQVGKLEFEYHPVTRFHRKYLTGIRDFIIAT